MTTGTLRQRRSELQTLLSRYQSLFANESRRHKAVIGASVYACTCGRLFTTARGRSRHIGWGQR